MNVYVHVQASQVGPNVFVKPATQRTVTLNRRNVEECETTTEAINKEYMRLTKTKRSIESNLTPQDRCQHDVDSGMSHQLLTWTPKDNYNARCTHGKTTFQTKTVSANATTNQKQRLVRKRRNGVRANTTM